MAFTYIVECADGSLYTGWTTDLKQRVALHNAGNGAKYTRGRRPVRLIYFEEHQSNCSAQKREWAIKQLTRAAKLELVAALQKADGFSE